jgi:phospholipase/carboxylesterase
MTGPLTPASPASLGVPSAGAPLARATGAVIMLHGRGATAQSILSLADVLAFPDLTYVAPQAPGGSWYPYSFLAPLADNEPALSRALGTVAALVDGLAGQGFGPERTVILGFSQGGCLGLEYAARNARRYGAVIGLSAGLIGPEGTPRIYDGSLAGTPVFLGCSDTDSHVPLTRVEETARVLGGLGAEVTERIYPGMGHTIVDDEIREMRKLLASLGPHAAP